MSALKILTIVGARPQFVKAATVSRAIQRHNAENPGSQIVEEIIHTGQHYDSNMSQIFFDEMEIPEPAANLEISGTSHGKMTGEMLAAIETEIVNRKPDWVIIYGDTNSTLAGALAAAKLHCPIAHVEAGLRSFNRRMPEEINRVVADHTSNLLLCPTTVAVGHLKTEGVTEGVHLVGDVMFDATLHYKPKAIAPEIDGNFILSTIHRAENTNDPARLKAIFAALAASPLPVLLPLHPRTRKLLDIHEITPSENINIVEPLGYFNMLGALQACSCVITDSGGLQKEAYFFDKKCITVRTETEWVELIDAGVNQLVEPDKLTEAISWATEKCEFPAGLYGNGDAAGEIVKILLQQKS